MKVLFDVGVHHALRRYLLEQGCEVETAQHRGWQNYNNGDLLDLAEQNGFQVLVTTDQKMEHELVIANWNVGVVVLGNTNWNYVKLYIADILNAIGRVESGTAMRVRIINPRKGC